MVYITCDDDRWLRMCLVMAHTTLIIAASLQAYLRKINFISSRPDVASVTIRRRLSYFDEWLKRQSFYDRQICDTGEATAHVIRKNSNEPKTEQTLNQVNSPFSWEHELSCPSAEKISKRFRVGYQRPIRDWTTLSRLGSRSLSLAKSPKLV